MAMMSAELYDALIEAGASQESARKAATAIAPADQVATKSDVTQLRGELNQFRTEVKAEFSAIRSEMKAEFSAIRGEMKAESAAIRSEFTARLNLQGWMIGTVVAMQIAIFVKLFIK